MNVKNFTLCLGAGLMLGASGSGFAQSCANPSANGTRKLIINEFNAVGDAKHIDDGNGCDPHFCVQQGNGNNWIELVVVGESGQYGYEPGFGVNNTVDLENVVIQWSNGDPDSGWVRLKGSVWNAVPVGTIVTIIEPEDPAQANLPAEDVSTDPANGDWNMFAYLGSMNDYVDVVTDGFKVDNDDWTARIVDIGIDDSGPVCFVQQRIGEAAPGWGGSGISSTEIGHLEKTPSTLVTAGDYDDADYGSFGCPNVWGHAAAGPGNPPTDIQDLQLLRIGDRDDPYEDNRCGDSTGGTDGYATSLSASWYDACDQDSVNMNEFDCES